MKVSLNWVWNMVKDKNISRMETISLDNMWMESLKESVNTSGMMEVDIKGNLGMDYGMEKVMIFGKNLFIRFVVRFYIILLLF